MDSLSSLGIVHTMEEDLAAARNKPRHSGVSVAPQKSANMVSQKIQVPVAPVGQPKKEPPKPPALPPMPAQNKPAPMAMKKEAPAAPPIRPKPPVSPTPPMLEQAASRAMRGVAPAKPLERAGVLASLPSRPTPPIPPAAPKPPAPKPAMPPMPAAPTPPPQPLRPAPFAPVPPIKPAPAAPSMPPIASAPIPGIGNRPSPKDLARFLPVEEEEIKKPLGYAEEKSLAIRQAPTPPFAPKQPLAAAPAQTPPFPEIPVEKKPTPEEILGLQSAPSVRPRTGAPAPTPGKTPSSPGLGGPIPSPAARPIPPIPPASLSPSYEEKRGLPFGLLAGVVAVLIIGLGGFAFWQIAHKPAAQAPAPPPPLAKNVNPPAPFFQPSTTNIITLQQGRESFLVEQIRALESAPGDPRSIAYIPIKKSADNTFLGTKEFFSLMNVPLPQELLDDVDNQFTLYAYAPGQEEKARCASANTLDPSCSSPRLGIVLKINADKQTAIQNIMSGFEPTFLQSFKPLILGMPDFDHATPWDTATYKMLSVRFSNLPISTTSLNWTSVGRYLVIATSKNSSYSVLDKFLSPAPPAQ